MQPVIIKDIDGQITVGYAGKALGNTQASLGVEAKTNFAAFTAMFTGKKVYDMPAVGQDKIIDVDTLTPVELDKTAADALVTRRAGTLLTLRAADCIPLVFYTPGLLALAHVGTSGAALHLPTKVINYLKIEPGRLHVYVGPSISPESYKFPAAEFEKKLDTSWGKYITGQNGHVHINLLGYVLDELAKAGIKPGNITVEPVDTGGDANYFSHRRHRLTGEPPGRNAFGVCLIN